MDTANLAMRALLRERRLLTIRMNDCVRPVGTQFFNMARSDDDDADLGPSLAVDDYDEMICNWHNVMLSKVPSSPSFFHSAVGRDTKLDLSVTWNAVPSDFG